MGVDGYGEILDYFLVRFFFIIEFVYFIDDLRCERCREESWERYFRKVVMVVEDKIYRDIVGF